MVALWYSLFGSPRGCTTGAKGGAIHRCPKAVGVAGSGDAGKGESSPNPEAVSAVAVGTAVGAA
jgi:hypothetical protein